MKNQNQRIFIQNLPETITPSELESTFGEYGSVKSVEIKERAAAALKKDQSLFFAYVNIETDDSSLQKCFQDFSQSQWHGRYIELQIAKENFLDRLKREREEAGLNHIQNDKVQELDTQPIHKSPIITNGFANKAQQLPNKSPAKRVYKSSSSSSSSSESDDEADVQQKPSLIPKVDVEEQLLDPIIIKNNKGRDLKNALKIDSVGNKPIVKIQSKKRQKIQKVSGSEIKRVNSVKEMIKGYQKQKILIKNALSRVDVKSKNIITFDDEDNVSKINETTDHNNVNHQLNIVDKEKKDVLFGEDDGEDEDESYRGNFSIDPQFEGPKGKQLLSLQSKFRNDKRFKMDERFIEDEVEEAEDNQVQIQDEDISVQEEKNKEMAILESVLGGRIKQKPNHLQRGMVRFDPTQPEHSKYEIPIDTTNKEKKKKKKDQRKLQENQEPQEIEQPIVSKEVFYKVTDNLKETLEQKQEFSLLGMLGRNHVENEEGDDSPNAQTNETKNRQSINGKDGNPFKYDSSDDEGGNQDEKKTKGEKSNEEKSPALFWSEPLFFKEDDFRLQDADDFMKRAACENEDDFPGLRRQLKEIVRSKVRNNQRRDKPFKKKLGGNKKKMIRIKKAIKR